MIGKTFGKYELLEKIGQGGMAELYLARHGGIGGFQKQVALKMILPSLAESNDSEKIVQMFLDEARLAARLDHPHIAQIYELGQAEGRYFLAMEYVDGVDLARLCRRAFEHGTPIPIHHAVKILSFVCEALAYAHQAVDDRGQQLHLVHRDVSPQNVLLGYNGAVKLTDFGVAKATLQVVQTEIGAIKGKLGYMSPEQIRSQKLDHRSDIFGAGILLYEITTGKRPFVGKSEVSILEAICNKPPLPPSEHRPGFPPELQAIIERALAKDPDQRFPDALEMQMALERFLLGSKEVSNASLIAKFVRELCAEPPTLPGAEETVETTLPGVPSADGAPEPQVPPSPQPPPLPSASRDAAVGPAVPQPVPETTAPAPVPVASAPPPVAAAPEAVSPPAAQAPQPSAADAADKDLPWADAFNDGEVPSAGREATVRTPMPPLTAAAGAAPQSDADEPLEPPTIPRIIAPDPAELTRPEAASGAAVAAGSPADGEGVFASSQQILQALDQIAPLPEPEAGLASPIADESGAELTAPHSGPQPASSQLPEGPTDPYRAASTPAAADRVPAVPAAGDAVPTAPVPSPSPGTAPAAAEADGEQEDWHPPTDRVVPLSGLQRSTAHAQRADRRGRTLLAAAVAGMAGFVVILAVGLIIRLSRQADAERPEPGAVAVVARLDAAVGPKEPPADEAEPAEPAPPPAERPAAVHVAPRLDAAPGAPPTSKLSAPAPRAPDAAGGTVDAEAPEPEGEPGDWAERPAAEEADGQKAAASKRRGKVATSGGSGSERLKKLCVDGNRALLQGRFQEAAELYERAYRIDPRSADANRGLDLAYTKLGRAEKAQRYFTAANRMILRGDFESAVKMFKLSLASDFRYADAHRGLGIAYARLGDAPSSNKHYRAYLAARPNAPDADKVRDIIRSTKRK